ncbi:hypothetical protein HAX54_005285 [Datura stramonium]|uniref:Uncharacterized protein n=1 Tax=Datura stramonium TaxID=4076 RepID=A0ABS8RUE2_DATST|nr:hypothetical protein [Datura stramonium]
MLLTKIMPSEVEELVPITDQVSVIIARTNLEKKGDSAEFTISCRIGHYDYLRALCDNGASINLMSLTNGACINLSFEFEFEKLIFIFFASTEDEKNYRQGSLGSQRS